MAQDKQQMKAAQYSQFSDDLKEFSMISAVQVPVPTPGPGDVLVKVLRAGANPVDCKLPTGAMAQMWRQPLPYTVGMDFSGVVVAVGEGVQNFQVSQEVWGLNLTMLDKDSVKPPGGAFAEYIVVDAKFVSPKPKEVSFDVAGGLGAVGTTAHQGLFKHLKVGAGTKLLILGGSTAVGFLAIQLARLKGAEVTTTSSTRSIEFVKRAQPHHIIDYTKTHWWEGKVYDVIFDTAGETDGLAHAKLALPKDGAFVTIANMEVGFDPTAHKPLTAYFFGVNNDDGAAVRDELSKLVKENKLSLPIDSSFPLTTEGVRNILKKQHEGKSLGKNLVNVAENDSSRAIDAKNDSSPKYVVITGGNQGIGLQTAIRLSEKGYIVTITARSDEKGKEAVTKILKAVPGAKVDYLLLNLLSFDSVRAFAKTYSARGNPLHVLLNNAGVVSPKFELTKEGVETTFQVNHLSHFLLTYLLWPRLQAAAPGARVINVSSGAYAFYPKPIDITAVTKVDTAYDPIQTYAGSKLANVQFTQGLERRLKGKGVGFFSLHPGVVDTGMMATAEPLMAGSGVDFSKAVTPDAGSNTSVYLATTPGLEQYSGRYFDDSKPAELSERAMSKEEQDTLWAGSLQLLGLAPDAF